MKAYVDQNTCIGCGLREGTAPEVFRMNDAGLAEAYSETDEAGKDQVQEAIDGCPVGAISWEE